MAECTKLDLRKAREAAHFTRWQAAQLLCVSEDSVKRWEDPSQKTIPTPADVSRMEEIYCADGLWWRWMRSSDDAFRDRLPAMPELELTGAILRLFAEIGDLDRLQQELMRDGADGEIDDPQLLDRSLKEVEDVLAVGYLLYCRLRRQKEKKGG